MFLYIGIYRWLQTLFYVAINRFNFREGGGGGGNITQEEEFSFLPQLYEYIKLQSTLNA